MNTKLYLQSFVYVLLLVSVSAYSDYYSQEYTGYIGDGRIGYGANVYGGSGYENAYRNGYVKGYANSYGGNGYVNSYGGWSSYGYPENWQREDWYRGGGNQAAWNRGGYYGARGVGSEMIYEQRFSPSSTSYSSSYSCNIIPGYYDGIGSWIEPRAVCTGN